MASNDKILDRVRQLLAIAEHPNTPEHEADVALRQANSLITKHAIEEAVLRAGQTEQQRRAPEKREIKIASGDGSFLPTLRTILEEIARANRCSVALTWYSAEVYGASEDVAWVEMLFMSIHFQLLSKMAPEWVKADGYDANVYKFKAAGFKWYAINELALKNDEQDARLWEKMNGRVDKESRTPYSTHEFRNLVIDEESATAYTVWGSWEQPTSKIKGTMIAAYKRHAKLIGDDSQIKSQPHIYKLSFLEGFKLRLTRRIREFAADNAAQMDTIPGAALAMVSMKEDINKAMYADHPDMDPEVQRARQRKLQEEREAMLAAMTPKQRTEFLEKEERKYARRGKRQKYYTPDMSAMGRGQKVADTVDLSRKAGSAGAGAQRGEIA